MEMYDKQSDPNLVKRTLNAALSSTPGLSIAWAMCKALYGNALELRQQRALEWVEMIRDNPNVFRKEILESADFQDGFIVALEEYLKLRTLLKRAAAQKIFIGFTEVDDKERFELERLNMTLSQISPNSLNFLAYIKSTVEPKRQEWVIETLNSIDFDSSPMDVEQAQEYIVKQNPLSYAYKDVNLAHDSQAWLPGKPDPQHPSMHSSTAITIKDSNTIAHEESLVELVNLGIMSRSRYTTPVSNTNPEIVYHDIWDYTNYGISFIQFLQQES